MRKLFLLLLPKLIVDFNNYCLLNIKYFYYYDRPQAIINNFSSLFCFE